MSGSPSHAQRAVTIELFRIGHCRAPAALTARGAGWQINSFPAGVALIQHPQAGAILFDTGYGAAFFAATAPLPERFYRWLTPVQLPPSQSLAQQLQKRRVLRPDLVILSHLHADHVAGLFDLPRPPPQILTSRPAIAGLARGRIASLRAGCPRGLRDALRQLPLTAIEDHPALPLGADGLGPFQTGYDLLQDGTLIAIPLPGHGIGQFGLYLPTAAGGAAFLIADAAWSLEALQQNRPPPRITLQKLGCASAYLATFAALRALQAARPELRLIPSHCPGSFPDEPL